MFKLTKCATVDNMNLIIELVLEEAESNILLTEKEKSDIRLICEEILVNIVHYAYSDKHNTTQSSMTVEMEFNRQSKALNLCFIDSGRAFNPLEKEEPDLSADAMDRQVGGLGIFMVKSLSDSISYERINGKNKLTVMKTCVGAGERERAACKPQ